MSRVNTIDMDLISIPACALYRYVGTVIVRLKMEMCCCSHRQERPVRHLPCGCELSKRTRLFSQYNCDCDSVVDKCRPYKSRGTRSRYVNVCAAVCLLLLVGGLSPQSSAAPHRTRNMERRAIGENPLWANPCDYNIDPNSKPASVSPKQTAKIASLLAAQARNVFTTTNEYRGKFAELHNFPSFEALASDWKNYEWLRKFSWYRSPVLPKEKILYSKMPDEYMNMLMKDIDDVLPIMFKGLKMIVAGLDAFAKEDKNTDLILTVTLKKDIEQSMNNVRAVLCFFYDIMKARNLEMLPLLEPEIPKFESTEDSEGLLLYIDTLNYLEYLAQVFEKIHETEFA